MTSFRIAFTELRRITAGRLPRLAVLAMIVIPTLYAGLYLYANHDPYGGLSRVPAALVVDDTGADARRQAGRLRPPGRRPAAGLRRLRLARGRPRRGDRRGRGRHLRLRAHHPAPASRRRSPARPASTPSRPGW